jgi:alkylresorcinol/alkylpyrone synthase
MHAPLARAGVGVDSRLDVAILSIATANPAYRINQQDAWERARGVFPHLARMEALYTNTGIETRYSCVPPEWCETPRSWEERTETHQHHALDLLQQVSVAAIAEAGLRLADIDFLVLNTITGLAIPSLDAKLMNRLAFRPDVERLPIFGLGCGDGVAGLARASHRQARATTSYS